MGKKSDLQNETQETQENKRASRTSLRVNLDTNFDPANPPNKEVYNSIRYLARLANVDPSLVMLNAAINLCLLETEQVVSQIKERFPEAAPKEKPSFDPTASIREKYLK